MAKTVGCVTWLVLCAAYVATRGYAGDSLLWRQFDTCVTGGVVGFAAFALADSVRCRILGDD